MTLRRVFTAALVALVLGGPLSVPASADSATCEDVNLPVLQQETVYGRLCTPGQPASTVFLLVAGGSYNSGYWDLPASLGLYSFRAGMNEAGYATLAVDRLGTGRSSTPLSATLTAFVQANALHQVVTHLRTEYQKVIIGGHSLGAATVILEAATYHDVDGVLVAGITHHIDPVDAVNVLAAMYPAALDPVLGGRNLDAGYLTTQPDARWRTFHRPAPVSQAVLSYEEATKDAFAATEAPDGLGVGVMTPYSILIDAPVLVAMGGQDELFCSPIPLVGTNCASSATIYAQEAPFYSPAARLRTYLLPGDYGHSFNFAPNADLFADRVVSWTDEMVG